MEEKNFHTILKEQIDLKSLNIQKLASATGIQERYLEAMIGGDTEKLPSSPYVRGYVIKLAAYLNLDGEELWSLYRKAHNFKTSGSKDILPQNRFAIKTISKNKIFAAAAAAALLIYAVTQFNHFVGVPKITITNPETAFLLSVAEQNFIVSGIIENPKDKLLINGEEVVSKNDGYFSKEIQLQPGINNIVFAASRFLGKEISIMRQILYQP